MWRHSRYFRVFRRAALQMVPTVLGILVLNFFLLNLMPGDAADSIGAQSGYETAETMHALRASLGLDQPLLVQLWQYIYNLFSLNLGYSAFYNAPVLTVVLQHLPNTLLLMATALIFAYLLGIGLGWIMSVYANRWPDRALTTIVLLLHAAPGFWLGLMFIVLFSAKLGWLPSSGNASIGADLTGIGWVLDRAKYLVLPALALSANFLSIYARLTRAAMLDTNNQDYIRTARAKGLHPLQVQWRHSLRNALIPVTTVAGLNFASVLSGAVVVESVFGWPGLGQITLDSVMARDFKVLLGIMLISSVVVIVTNALLDLVLAWLDPRIEIE